MTRHAAGTALSAADVLARRWSVSEIDAVAALAEIAERIGVEVEDLAALITRSELERRSAY